MLIEQDVYMKMRLISGIDLEEELLLYYKLKHFSDSKLFSRHVSVSMRPSSLDVCFLKHYLYTL